jgi:hypothetical protein
MARAQPKLLPELVSRLKGVLERFTTGSVPISKTIGIVVVAARTRPRRWPQIPLQRGGGPVRSRRHRRLPYFRESLLVHDPGGTVPVTTCERGRKGQRRRSCVWRRTGPARQLGLGSPWLRNLRDQTWGSMSFRRGDGETIWRSDRHRIILIPDRHSPVVVQVEQGRTRQIPIAPPGTLSFYPAGLTVRVASPAARFMHAVWDTDLYSILLPELGAAASRFEFVGGLQDPLLSQIVTALAEESEGGFSDRILIESLGTALCLRIARRFVGASPPADQQGPLAGALAAALSRQLYRARIESQGSPSVMPRRRHLATLG